jgi:hypothetical protein
VSLLRVRLRRVHTGPRRVEACDASGVDDPGAVHRAAFVLPEPIAGPIIPALWVLVRARALAPILDREATMTEDELIELLRERQNNGRTAYLTFGDLVAMVPLDQMDEWRAVLAKVRASDAARDAEEDAD